MLEPGHLRRSGNQNSLAGIGARAAQSSFRLVQVGKLIRFMQPDESEFLHSLEVAVKRP